MPPTWLGLYKVKKSTLFSSSKATNHFSCSQHFFLPNPLLFSKNMEFSTFHPSTWNSFFTSPLLFPHQFIPENYVHWRETPESHIYSADLPGVKKEEIKVEIEDSSYLIIRTEAANETTEPIRSFMRKFRLPGMVDMEGISASYRDGVLTVTVPRTLVRRGFFIEPNDLPERMVNLGASAA